MSPTFAKQAAKKLTLSAFYKSMGGKQIGQRTLVNAALFGKNGVANFVGAKPLVFVAPKYDSFFYI